ncbi:hypothetical protein TeGR_g11122 [Tetraparma gracilis]|uniref:Ubiquitin carboxyl-terminal hydrolase n=1 Tax=Tetraparma gracilis TaxID=2962635 RepID=A0ABQ6N9S6_9STRA|nr:hypothetical protein TeGR_g11122 [Tetraparma gracilis]
MTIRRSQSAPIPTRSLPVGINNVGNTCFANSALQCLLSSSLLSQTLHEAPSLEFSSPLRSATPGRAKRVKTKSANAVWLQKELHKLLCSYQSSSRAVDAGNITRHVDKLSSCLRFGRQEDAHEFVRALLDLLCLDGFNKHVSKLFEGGLESAVTCQTCDNVSRTKDRYMDLSLDIDDTTTSSLEAALRRFTMVEKLSADCLVDCARCRVKRRVTKGLLLSSAPSVLTFHLKRFTCDRYGRIQRISKHVGFPAALDLSPYLTSGKGDTGGGGSAYSLFAIVCHRGQSVNSGHYIAYVKRDGRWYEANDSRIRPVTEKEVLQQPAYMIFYEKAKGGKEAGGERIGKEGAAEKAAEKVAQRERALVAVQTATPKSKPKAKAKPKGRTAAADTTKSRLRSAREHASKIRSLSAPSIVIESAVEEIDVHTGDGEDGGGFWAVQNQAGTEGARRRRDVHYGTRKSSKRGGLDSPGGGRR